MEETYNIHPRIQFTMNHTFLNPELERFECKTQESIPFLDSECQIKNGKIVTDLYCKPTDRNQYLLKNSCSPASVIKNIPFSLALRILRICSEEEARELRFSEPKELLLARSYRLSMVDTAIDRARTIPRSQALRQVNRQRQCRRPVNVVSFDPRLTPDIQSIH